MSPLNSFGPRDGVIGGRKNDKKENTMPPIPSPIEIPANLSIITPSFTPGCDNSACGDMVTGNPWEFLPPCQPGTLSTGCYYIRYIPPSVPVPPSKHYEGTLRLQKSGNYIIASGDLYRRELNSNDSFFPLLNPNLCANYSIPIFPRDQYAYYLRLTRIIDNNIEKKTIQANLETFHFEQKDHTWWEADPLTVELRFCIAMNGTYYWDGDIKTQAGLVMGRLLMMWIAPFYRQAVLEIDKTHDAEFPRCYPPDYPLPDPIKPVPNPNQKKITWESIFRNIGWDLKVMESDQFIKTQDDRWNTCEIHKAMLDFRDECNLDAQWHYHLLTVGYFERDNMFGIMYSDSTEGFNKIPREGAAVSFKTPCPDDDCYGVFRNKPFYEAGGAFFRTAVHEIGHAMMLRHPNNPRENHFMQITNYLAKYHNINEKFPENINWNFSQQDIHLLCHLPDIAIRPGGLSFKTKLYQIPICSRDEVVKAQGLELTVKALHDLVPIGAPVRVDYYLKNTSETKKIIPSSFSIKTGQVSGYVIEPSGTTQEFTTIVRSIGDISTQDIDADDEQIHSVTLLWGTQGPLFPAPGFYRIVIDITWNVNGTWVQACGSTGIMVSGPENEEHARIALRIFSHPDILVTLAVGGDHMEEGNKLIDQAIQNPILKPHYNLLKAKRFSMRFFDRQPNIETACNIIEDETEKSETVMSHAEVYRMAKILSWAKNVNPNTQIRMANILLKKAEKVNAIDKIKKVLKELNIQENSTPNP